MTADSPQIPQLSPLLATERLLDGALLLDVRNDDERAAGFAPDSLFIPLPELEQRADELDAQSEYVVVCRLGGRSEKAAEFLAAKGYTVSNLDGGMTAWAAAGLEVTTPDGGAGTII